ncbi:MAG TPA: preprotein translocase subunit YajC [Candidatus Sulfotelmatobacter sp.]|nr:preprotein translocase subunit YajC [Candidatus Sulfotelmatobacter sp.]
MQALLLLQAPGGGGLSLLIMFVPMIAIFYFLLILPQQRRQKKWQAMLDQLKTGDKVTTSGGLRGTVVALKDDAIHLRVPPDNLRLEVTKASVAVVTTPEEEPKGK